MTAIACWIESSQHVPTIPLTVRHLWAVADSRVSDTVKDQSGDRVYRKWHDHAAKIFSVPIKISAPGSSGRFNRLVYQNSIGLAYSGSTLTGLNMSVAAAPLLGSLVTLQPQALPRLSDVADLIGRLLRDYVRSYGSTVGERAIAECAVLGFCPVERELQIFTVRPRINSSVVEVEVEKFETSSDASVLLLGDCKTEIQELINSERANLDPGSGMWWRAPRTIIERCISDANYPTIGGTIQLGVGNSLGFELMWVCIPTGEGAKASLGYLGLTVLEEHLPVGPCYIGMSGMA